MLIHFSSARLTVAAVPQTSRVSEPMGSLLVLLALLGAVAPALSVPTNEENFGRVSERSPPPRPIISETFSASTIETDDTVGAITLRQVLHRDYKAHRMWVSFNGSLVQGAMVQITRCDLHPWGWLASAGGRDTTRPQTWQCSNSTLDPAPDACQWSPFWDVLPANATYAGLDVVDGRVCDRWNYWDHGEQFAMWYSAYNEDAKEEQYDGNDTSSSSPIVPVALAKTWTSTPGYHLWTLLWRNFTAEAPSFPDDFAMTPGVVCPPASPSGDKEQGDSVYSKAAASSQQWPHSASLSARVASIERRMRH